MNGQINFFFCIKLASERLLHCLPFISVCCRKFLVKERGMLNKISCTDTDSYHKDITFTACTDMFSTVCSVTAFDIVNKPFITDEHSKVDAKGVVLPYSNRSKTEVDYIVLTDLKPERLKIKFDKLNSEYYKIAEK